MKADMSHANSLLPDLEPGIDPVLADILETYLTSLEQGAMPDRQAFLALHPNHADALATYLPWIELLYQAKPREADAGANPPMPTRLGDFCILRVIRSRRYLHRSFQDSSWRCSRGRFHLRQQRRLQSL